MRLPYMQVAPSRTQDMRVGFGGLNLREDAAEGEFSFTQNLSSERYPYVAPRRPRTKFYSIEGGSVNGIFGGADFLLYAVDTGLYRISMGDTGPTATQIGTVENSKKQFVRMGAYVLVWPDKAIYNSETGAFEKIEHAYTASGTVTLTQTNLAGEASDTATYIKVAASGIDDGLNDYDGVTLSGLTGSGAAFNGAQVVYAHGEDYIIIAGILEETHSQTGNLTVSRDAPDMDYLTECGNRVWGCSSENHEIYACKLGDPRNWNVFLGLANDSYAATIGSDGDFTGAATINDTVVFFKENAIHKVLGTKPANYQITTTPARGVMAGCAESVCVVDEALYYVSREGVMGYDGSIPISVGDKLAGMALRDAVAGAWHGRYYINAQAYDAPVQLVYDARQGLWYREDDTRMSAFARAFDGALYALIGSDICCLTDSSAQEIVPWSMVTGRILLETPGYKYVTGLILHIDARDSASKTKPPAISIQYDSGAWEPCHVHSPRGRGVVYLAIPAQRRASYARLKIEGRGDFVLFGLSKITEVGTELGRSWAR